MALDRDIVEFIKLNLLKQVKNGVVIQRSLSEVIREIFMLGWDNYDWEEEKKK